MSNEQLREALQRIQYKAVSLADAQVIALEALASQTTSPAAAPAPAVPSVQQGWVEQMLTDARHVFDAGGAETPQETRDVIEYVASWIAAYRDNLATTTAAPSQPVTLTNGLIEKGAMTGMVDAQIDAIITALREKGKA